MERHVTCGDVVIVPSDGKEYEVHALLYKGKPGKYVGRNVHPAEEMDYFRLRHSDAFKDCPCTEVDRFPRLKMRETPVKRLGAGKQKGAGIDAVQRFADFVSDVVRLPGGRTFSVKGILDIIRNAGYETWLAGGAIRDLIRPDLLVKEAPNDADLAGTLLFDTFRRLVANVVLAAGLGFGINDDKHVAYIYHPNGQDNPRLLEYAPLKLCYVSDGIESYYLFDHELEADGHWRDITINALFYELPSATEKAVVLDLTGQGWDHLKRQGEDLVLCPIDVPPDRPLGAAASRLLRLLKFVKRYSIDKKLRVTVILDDTYVDTCRADFLKLDDDRRRFLILSSFYGKATTPKPDPIKLRDVCLALGNQKVMKMWEDLFEPCLKL